MVGLARQPLKISHSDKGSPLIAYLLGQAPTRPSEAMISIKRLKLIGAAILLETSRREMVRALSGGLPGLDGQGGGIRVA